VSRALCSSAAGAYHPYVSDEIANHPQAIATPQLGIKAYVPCHVRHMTPAESVECYRAHVTGGGWPLDWRPRPGFTIADIRAELGGHDLACWCPLDQPCHVRSQWWRRGRSPLLAIPPMFFTNYSPLRIMSPSLSSQSIEGSPL